MAKAKGKKTKKDIYMSALGHYGGSQTLKKHGREHFSEMGKKRWEKVKDKKIKIKPYENDKRSKHTIGSKQGEIK